MRVAIVNDLAVACEALRRVVVSDPALSIAWIARDGDEAIAKAATDRPDVILMDLIMPRVNGVEATRAIMRASPCPILVVTATVTGNASLVYEALGVGALDAVNTPTLGSGGSVAGGAELLRRLHLVARMAQVRGQASSSPVASPVSSPTSSPISSPTSSSTASPASSSTSSSRPTLAGFAPPSFAAKNVLGTPPQSARPTLVAIGASTGGPRAVADVLLSLPRDLRAAYLVVQHVSVEFVAGYAQWLAAETGRRVVLARSGDVPQVGDVLVAGEDSHLTVNRLGTLEYRDEPKEHIHKPSVDELFTSLASSARPGVAVLLTGMGRDGAEGLLTLRRAGWHTIAQDESSSVVWGMPGAAHRLGAAVEVLPIRAIGPAVVAAMRGLPP